MSFKSLASVISILVLFAGLRQAHAAADPAFPNGHLQPFTTDACTLFPDGTDEEPTKWRHCCVLHDLKYWAGGTRAARLSADEDLRACVALTGEPEIADLMFVGVRAGGSAILPTPWRWGYGWPQLRGYAELNEEERAQVVALTADPLLVPIVKIGGH